MTAKRKRVLEIVAFYLVGIPVAAGAAVGILGGMLMFVLIGSDDRMDSASHTPLYGYLVPLFFVGILLFVFGGMSMEAWSERLERTGAEGDK